MNCRTGALQLERELELEQDHIAHISAESLSLLWLNVFCFTLPPPFFSIPIFCSSSYELNTNLSTPQRASERRALFYRTVHTRHTFRDHVCHKRQPTRLRRGGQEARGRCSTTRSSSPAQQRWPSPCCLHRVRSQERRRSTARWMTMAMLMKVPPQCLDRLQLRRHYLQQMGSGNGQVQ